MSSSSTTVATLAVQMARLADAQNDLRALVLDVLKEMLQISSVQAQANADFIRLVAEERQTLRAFQNVGPGTSRDYNEVDEGAKWRDELNKRGIEQL